jgi:hypothetical protein
MNYHSRLRDVLMMSPPEIYPGQNAELCCMTEAHGCDINEHVPTLVQYGRMVQSITEMGVRFGWSTRSFLFARPKRLVSIDKFEWNSIHQAGGNASPGNSQFKRYQELYRGVVDFSYVLGDTTRISPIEGTDLLFIDTFHHRSCLEKELDLHGGSARRFIILHDTETFGEIGQADSSRTFVAWDAAAEPGSGLRYAVSSWLVGNPAWRVREVFTNNNGLTVLEKVY